MIKPQYIYLVKDRATGKIVFRGTNYEVAAKFGCNVTSVKNGKLVEIQPAFFKSTFTAPSGCNIVRMINKLTN